MGEKSLGRKSETINVPLSRIRKVGSRHHIEGYGPLYQATDDLWAVADHFGGAAYLVCEEISGEDYDGLMYHAVRMEPGVAPE